MARRKALAEYDAKRDFTRTPEPKGGGETAGNSFVVQKHWARRTHYDFRIELDGVLVSWAVTKTPNLDPSVKRLAVRTEDHPVSYGGFEGVIPAGEYGGGVVMLWDKGVWAPREGDPREGLEKGSLKLWLNAERMKGGWALVRLKPEGKRENWLLIKERDEFASRDGDAFEAFQTSVETNRTRDEIETGAPRRETTKTSVFKPPAFILPMLCDTRPAPPEGGDWIHELKYDGYRVQAACDGATVRLFTREGHDWTPRFPAIAQALAALNLESATLDGEAVVFGADGMTDFAALVDNLEAGGRGVSYAAFDILREGGDDVRALPLLERKARLTRALAHADGDVIRVASHIQGGGADVFAKVAEGGGEGIISKRANSIYKSGRSPHWLKVKADKRADVTIVGYMPSQKRAFASLLCAVEEGGALRFAGGVGTGFSDKRLSEINSALATIGLDKPVANLQFDVKPQRGARWVEPLYKAELAIGGWTREGQLRQARFLGWREDIAPVEAKPSPAPREARKTAEGDPLTRITHPERVMFPETGMTKRQVAEYYLRVAPLILPHLEGRPVSFVRAPEGIGEETFFQRHVLPGMKRGIVRVPDPRGDHKDYLAIDGEEGLITAAQFGVIEFHGWGARLPDLNAPDRVVFDLDPDEGLPFSAVRDAAFDLRKILGVMELQSFPMATGGKGVHVIVPLGRKQGWDEVEAFASGVARGLAATAPDRYVATMSKAKRTGKIFVDWLRNQRSATAILPWSLRARARSTIAAPVTWAALKMLNAANGHTALAFKPGKTPSPEFFKLDQSISPAALKYLRTFR